MVIDNTAKVITPSGVTRSYTAERITQPTPSTQSRPAEQQETVTTTETVRVSGYDIAEDKLKDKISNAQEKIDKLKKKIQSGKSSIEQRKLYVKYVEKREELQRDLSRLKDAKRQAVKGYGGAEVTTQEPEVTTTDTTVTVEGQGYSVAPSLQQEFIAKKTKTTPSESVSTSSFDVKQMTAPRTVNAQESFTPEQKQEFMLSESQKTQRLLQEQEQELLARQREAYKEGSFKVLAGTSTALAIQGAGRAPENFINVYSPVTTQGKLQVPIVQPTYEFGKYLVTGDYVEDLKRNPAGFTGEFITTLGLLKTAPAKSIAKAEVNIMGAPIKYLAKLENKDAYVRGTEQYIKYGDLSKQKQFDTQAKVYGIVYELETRKGQADIVGKPAITQEVVTPEITIKKDVTPSVQYELPKTVDTYTYAGSERGFLRTTITEVNPKIATEINIISEAKTEYKGATERQTKLVSEKPTITIYDEGLLVGENLPKKIKPYDVETPKVSNKNIVDNTDKFNFEVKDDLPSNARQVSSLSSTQKVSTASYDTELVTPTRVTDVKPITSTGMLPITMAMYERKTDIKTEQPTQVGTMSGQSQFQGNLPRLETRPTQESTRKLIVDPILDTQPVTRTVTRTTPIQISTPVTETVPATRPVQQSALRTVPVQKPVTEIKPPTVMQRPQETYGQQIFTAKAKVKGKFVTLGTFGTIGEAFNRGKQFVESTASATFKVESGGAVVRQRGFLPKGFTPSKSVKGGVVQQRGFRITSQGEKLEITAKGRQAQKIRRIFNKRKRVF